MVTGKALADVARTAYEQNKGKRIRKRSGGSTLEGLDCGGFVKYCFRQCGQSFDLKGTNDLFRRSHEWRGTLEDTRRNGKIKEGSLAFIVKQDGGERKRNYHDGLGNSVCVGIVSQGKIIYYSGDNEAILETRINSTTHKDWWSHFMNISIVDYD